MGPPGERPPGLPAPPKPLAAAVARVLALVPDLMLASRVEATLAGEGHEVATGLRAAEPRSLADADLVVADVGEVDPGSVAGNGVRRARVLSPHGPRHARRARRPPGSTWWFRARGWPGSCRSWSLGCSAESAGASALRTCRQAGARVVARRCRGRSPSESHAISGARAKAPRPGMNGVGVEQRPELRLAARRGRGRSCRRAGRRGLARGCARLEPVAPHRRLAARRGRAPDRRARACAARAEPSAPGIAAPRSRRRETRGSAPLSLERDALGVPERGGGVHLAGGERGDRLEADRHPVHGGDRRHRPRAPSPAPRRRRAAR